MNKDVDTVLNAKFVRHIQEGTMKNILLISFLAVLTICYYIYSDLYVRKSIDAFYIRLLPLSLAIFLLIFHGLTKQKFVQFKFGLYNSLFASAVLMMYGICIVHLHGEGLAPSVTGTVLVVFLMSLELKTNNFNALLIYFLPLLVFTLLLVFIFKPSSKEITVMADIYPIVLAGFAINRIQYKLRYKLYKSNSELENERQRTEQLYEETLVINEDLDSKVREVIQHKEEVQEANEALIESNATKDKFFAIIAHDLKSPFNSILGFSRSLFENFDKHDDEKKKRYAHNIYRSSSSTYKLLENLLIWAQSQNNNFDFNPAKYHLLELMSNSLDPLIQAATDKSINVVNLTATDVYVYVDKNMLETILRNLVSNAIKFTPKNGDIVINAQTIFSFDKHDKVEISISDTGLGMSAEKLKNLFVVSKNNSTKGTDNEEGTGLGLLLCEDFVTKNKGTIQVESTIGKGSTFVVTLPAEQM